MVAGDPRTAAAYADPTTYLESHLLSVSPPMLALGVAPGRERLRQPKHAVPERDGCISMIPNGRGE